ncbi:MAG: Lrp/AsnC family transcriptional regulator [Candidatus Nanoarchaeia archaeon]
MKLKPSDQRLLAYLYHHNREPITKIAKATGLSRDQVEYKINKWVKEGFIRKFGTVFNYPKLGYEKFIPMAFNVPEQKLEVFFKSLEKDKNCISVGENIGNHNVYVIFIFKNDEELNFHLAGFLEKHKNIVQDYILFDPFFTELYPMKPINYKDKKPYKLDEKIGPLEKLNNTDKKLLSLLEKDGRMKLVGLAKALNISAELAFHKIKKFQKNGIILGNRLDLDLKKLGYHYSDIFLDVKNLSSETQDKLKNFARNNDHINSIMMMFGKPNCMLQVFNRNQRDLLEIIKEIRKLLGSNLHSYDLMFPQQEHKLNTLPFL